MSLPQIWGPKIPSKSSLGWSFYSFGGISFTFYPITPIKKRLWFVKPLLIWTKKVSTQRVLPFFQIQVTMKWLSLPHPEAATRDVLWKRVFLEISQNSPENTCARASLLIKLQASNLFYKTPRDDCFFLSLIIIDSLSMPYGHKTSSQVIQLFNG